MSVAAVCRAAGSRIRSGSAGGGWTAAARDRGAGPLCLKWRGRLFFSEAAESKVVPPDFLEYIKWMEDEGFPKEKAEAIAKILKYSFENVLKTAAFKVDMEESEMAEDSNLSNLHMSEEFERKMFQAYIDERLGILELENLKLQTYVNRRVNFLGSEFRKMKSDMNQVQSEFTAKIETLKRNTLKFFIASLICGGCALHIIPIITDSYHNHTS